MGRKVGRNAPCPCRSGLKFKNCCLERAKGVPPPLDPARLPGEPWAVNLLQAVGRAGVRQGTLVPSVEFKGYRFRAVRHRLYWRPPQETFHEFLIHLLKRTLGAAWHREQVGLPLEQRHQIHRWFKALADYTRLVVGDERFRDGRVYGAAPTGDVQALITLAYDVYHLLHRGDLPRRVLDRLKSRDGFQGARYEIAVAATFVRAGFEIGFIEEMTQKHCEFIARDPSSGAEVAVEAKSRHREGVLHQSGQIDEFRVFRGMWSTWSAGRLRRIPGTGRS